MTIRNCSRGASRAQSAVRVFRLGCLCAAMALTLGLSAPSRAAVGDPMPEFSLPDVVSGEAVSPAGLFEGKVGALSFMQTSCAACRKELLALKEIQAKYPDLQLLAISVDSGNPARVKRYKEHFGFEFPFLHDPEFKTPDQFGFSFTPALVLVGKDGTIALLKGGYRPGDEVKLEGLIAALLEK